MYLAVWFPATAYALLLCFVAWKQGKYFKYEQIFLKMTEFFMIQMEKFKAFLKWSKQNIKLDYRTSWKSEQPISIRFIY